MFCKNCGKEIDEKAYICTNCGVKVNSSINIKNRKKNDKGFEFNYWNLSYRRKFIRTLFLFPIGIIIIGYLIYNDNKNLAILFSIVFFIGGLIQLLYNYDKWKNSNED